MKNLIIITTPFQLIGAFEAIYKLKLKKIILIVIYNRQKNNSIQMKNLIKYNRDLFYEIIHLENNKKSKFLNYIKTIYKLKKDEFKNILIGDLGSVQKVFISNLNTKKIFLLDDGAKTILIHKYCCEKFSLFKNDLKLLRFKLFGLKLSTKKRLNFFTFFRLSSIKNIEIIKHNFDFLKKTNNFKNKVIENKVYILGQPLVENSRIKKDAYECYINSIMRLYKDCEIFYLMHRREDINNLTSYDFKKKLNIVKSLTVGELYFAKLEYKPISIVGVNSTLLLSLLEIFDDLSVFSYQFSNGDILRSRDWFEASRNYFIKHKINIIKKGDLF